MTEPTDLVEQVLVLKDVDLVVDLLSSALKISARVRSLLGGMPDNAAPGFHVGLLTGLQMQMGSLLSSWEEEYRMLRDAFESKEDPPCPA